jgi:aryl-alcohol dehydrogenase-like predicted oxidoreductase/glycosyltransferase involved in cell wall biosynthesis
LTGGSERRRRVIWGSPAVRDTEAAGLRVSVIGLGTAQYGLTAWGWGRDCGPGEVAAVCRRAVELGVTLFDTAESYGDGESERQLGAALADVNRDRIVLATKTSPYGLVRERVLAAARGSLGRLRTDRIDLYQIHGPDWRMAESIRMAGMRGLLESGEIRHVGVCNYPLSWWKEAEAALGRPVASNQVRYSLLTRAPERDLLPWAQANGRLIIAWSPLEQGLLTGKYVDAAPRFERPAAELFSPGNLNRAAQVLHGLREVADARGATPAQVALAWIISHPGVVAIPGAKNVAQLEENAAAADLVLAGDEVAHLTAVADRFRPAPQPGPQIRRYAQRVARRVRQLSGRKQLVPIPAPLVPLPRRPRSLRIAIFDYSVVPTNPIGSCHRRMLEGLCEEHDFTVFSVHFDNPCPERIAWIRIRVPTRPLALQFFAYQLVAPLYYLAYRLRTRTGFDLVQMVESNLWFGDVSYAQFCHRGFLRLDRAQTRAHGLRGLLRWLDHRLHAIAEPWVFRRVRHVVVPSRGLAHELETEYPITAGKVTVIPNPVDVRRFLPPDDGDRRGRRSLLGLDEDDVAITFIALGHFERKGLPLLLEALRSLGDPHLKLVVVGGQPDLVRAYERTTADLGLRDTVSFVGMQEDVRPFLWASDAFALPSAYEAGALVTYQAAAAGLPLLVTPLHGAEELVVEGENGFVVQRTVADIAAGLRKLTDLTTDQRRQMGKQAAEAAQRYGIDEFTRRWSDLYPRLTRA